ncbi:alpha/beta hydrolase [Pseudonocardiaceae bacterium YIM PH 21723]|nr:alpha/beta hydrolase [Pseudonocardiaceae bacterium YIM PH 21723]
MTMSAEPTARGRVLPIVAGLVLVLSLAVAGLLFFDRSPFNPLSGIPRAFPLHNLIFTLAALVIGVLAVRRRRKVVIGMALVAALVSGAAAIVPLQAQAETAEREHYLTSPGDYLRHGLQVNHGLPDRAKSVQYAAPGGHPLEMDIWPATNSGEGKAVLLIHGGAWREGTRGDTPEWNKLLNRLGYTVFDVDYRLLGEVPAGQAWEATVTDSKCALAWVTANAEKYKINPDRISVMGQSAGGHLALMTAYSSGSGKLPPSCDLPEGKAKSVLDFYGPVDMVKFVTGPDGSDEGKQLLNAVLGGSLAEQEQRYRDFSPSSYFREGLPPTLILQGTSDFLVPQSQSHELQDRLTGLKVPNRAIYLPYTDHAFDLNWGAYPTQIARQAVTEFLAANG